MIPQRVLRSQKSNKNSTLNWKIENRKSFFFLALNNDYKLILLSESTIPTKSFNYIYDYLTKGDKGYLNYNMTEKSIVKMQTAR